MRRVKYLLIGGGAASVSAASQIRKMDTEGEITIVGDEVHLGYNRVLLPYYLKEEMPKDRLFLKKEEFYRTNNIDFITGRKVVAVDFKERRAKLDDGSQIGYERLLIATGGNPVKLNLPGASLEGVYNLYTIDDTEAIIRRAKETKIKAGAVLGGSYIAIELIHGFIKHGLRTIVLLRGGHIFRAILDPVSASIIERRLIENGVEIRRNEVIAQIWGDGEVKGVVTTRGDRIECGLVGIGIGIARNVEFIREGPEINRGIITDEYLETRIPGVYAAGDVAEFWDMVLNRRLIMGNFDNASAQGTAVGKVMAGGREPFIRVSSYSIMVFGLPLATIGDITNPPGTEVVLRGDPNEGELAQLFLRDGRIVGATLVGQMRDAPAIKNLIMSKTDISGAKEALVARGFKLKDLLS